MRIDEFGFHVDVSLSRSFFISNHGEGKTEFPYQDTITR